MMMMMMMTGRRRLFIVVALLLHHSTSALAEPDSTESLFFTNQQQQSAAASSRTVQAGEDVVLECEAAGRPSPTIYWQHEGLRLNPPTSDESEHRSLRRNAMNGQAVLLELGSTKARLYIDCARQSDAGLYTCVAETPTKRIATTTFLSVEAKDGSQPATAAHCINKRPVLGGGGGAQRPARINMWTTMMLDFEGANALLFCRTEGNPHATVTWFDPEDRRIISSSTNRDDQYLITESGDLVIRDVSWSRNMGLYKCYAHNSHGSDHSETFLYPTVP